MRPDVRQAFRLLRALAREQPREALARRGRHHRVGPARTGERDAFLRDTPVLVDVARLRVAITGAPHTGKTTLAYQLASQLSDHPTVVSTDSYQHLGWFECSARVAEIVAGQVNDRPWSGIVEGVAVPRVLRKLLRAAPTVRPVDRLIILEHVHGEPLTARQAGMGQGLLTVLLGPVDDQVPGSPRVLDALRDLGVAVEVR